MDIQTAHSFKPLTMHTLIICTTLLKHHHKTYPLLLLFYFLLLIFSVGYIDIKIEKSIS